MAYPHLGIHSLPILLLMLQYPLPLNFSSSLYEGLKVNNPKGGTIDEFLAIMVLGGLGDGEGYSCIFIMHLMTLFLATHSSSLVSCSSMVACTCCTTCSTSLFPCMDAYWPTGVSPIGGNYITLELDS